jgi:hypothetical protein
MLALIAQVRKMIADPESADQQFDNQTIQDKLDEYRDDVRYLRLTEAPSIVNAASTNNQAEFVFADYYSAGYQSWESDAVLQGDLNGSPWKVLTPLASNYIAGHFQFQLTPFTNGTAPGQWPPVYVTGKVYDLYHTAADLLEFWAACLTSAYDISANGQSLRRSQMLDAKLRLATQYRRSSRPGIAKMIRRDVAPIGGIY